MSIPATNPSSTVPPTTSTVPPTTTTAPQGVSSGGSSITPAAPAESPGYCAQISAWWANVCASIRSFLASIPLIGDFFKDSTPATSTPGTTTGTTTPGTTTPGTAPTTWTDAERVNMIRGQFVPAPATTATTTVAATPSAYIADYTINLFRQIQSPVSKMEAFQAVLVAQNSTDDIARLFYNVLPEGTITAGRADLGATKQCFKEYIWRANARGPHEPGFDNGLGANYGDHMIATAIRGPLPKQAAQNLLNAIAAAPGGTTTTSV